MRRFAPLLLLPIVLYAAGCGNRPAVLAQVGNREITVEDFREVLAGNEKNYPVEPDSAKQMALRDMMRRELLVVAALDKGLDKDSTAVRYRRNVEDRVLVETYYQRQAPADIPVSQGEIAEFYAQRDSASHVMLIYTADRKAAESALADLKAGKPFARVADQYNLAGVMPPGGDIGFRVSGDLVEPLDGYLRTAPVGQVVGPLQAPTEGWFILKVVERRKNPTPPLAEISDDLARMLRQRKQRALATRAYTGLRDRYGIEVASGGPQLIFRYYNNLLSGESAGKPAPQPDAAQLAEVVGRYHDAGGTPQVYTFGEALADLRNSQRARPDMNLVPAIQRWIENQLVRRSALLEAKRMHLEDEPDVKRRIDREQMTYLVNSLFTIEVTNQIHVDEADVRAAYERRKDVIKKPFDELTPAERNAISTDAATFKSEARFEAYTDSLARVIRPYKMNEQRLAALAWPLTPPAGS